MIIATLILMSETGSTACVANVVSEGMTYKEGNQQDDY